MCGSPQIRPKFIWTIQDGFVCPATPARGLSKNVCDGSRTFLDQVERATVEDEIHFPVVETELLQDRGLEVRHVVTVCNRFVTYFIRRAFDYSAFDSSAREQSRKAHGIVVAPGGVL